MFNLNKTAIAPIVAVICLFIGTVSGHPIGQSVQDQVVTFILAGVTLGTTIWGVWKDHQKK